MKRAILFVAYLIVLGLPVMAFADPPEVNELSDLVPNYLALSALSATEESAISRIFMEDEVTVICTYGGLDWYLNVSECYAEDIDTCWVYFDGEIYTGTTVALCTESYRDHYGAVVVKYEDDTFDYAGFRVISVWPNATEEYVESLNNAPPMSPDIPASLPYEAISVFTAISEIDPDGPRTATWNGHCNPKTGACDPTLSSGRGCMSSYDCPQP
ncbi:hypothetical protein JW859_02580 [bacterium]|nr:hypothetical protein [bacterium]